MFKVNPSFHVISYLYQLCSYSINLENQAEGQDLFLKKMCDDWNGQRLREMA